MFRFLMRKKLHKLQERCLQKKKSVGEKGEKNNSNSLVTSVT